MRWSYVVFFAAAALFAVFSLLARLDLHFTEETCGPKSHLSSVRSAIQVYYGDHEGRFPADDLSCLVPKYLGAMPLLWDDSCSRRKYPHPPTREVVTYQRGEAPRDTGNWAYFNDPGHPASWGNFVIDCTHVEVLKGPGLFSAPRPGYPWSVF